MITLLLTLAAVFLVDLLRASLTTSKVRLVLTRERACFVRKLSRLAQVVELQKQKRLLLERSAQLNREAAKLTSPSTFAQCAKLQRIAIVNEKQAEKLGAEQVITPTAPEVQLVNTGHAQTMQMTSSRACLCRRRCCNGIGCTERQFH